MNVGVLYKYVFRYTNKHVEYGIIRDVIQIEKYFTRGSTGIVTSLHIMDWV